jgi:uncharacterized protein YbjT (DUF2867 family)
MARPEPHRAFTIGVEVVPGTTLAQARGLERCIEDYADAHELQIAGHHLTYVVSAAERSLTAADQVDLLDWLIDQPGVRNVRLSPLAASEAPATWSEGFLLVATCDVPAIGLKLLYRCRRITSEQYLQILGGFVRSLSVH